MYLASWRDCPETPVLATRSDPARSTKHTLARRTRSLPFCRRSTVMVKMQCERDDARFMGVSVMARLVSPKKRRLSASSSVSDRCTLQLTMRTLPSSSSWRVTLGRSSSALVSWSGSRRSYAWLLYTST